MATDKKTEEVGSKGQALIDEACDAYGIDKQYLLGARVDPGTGEAVLVTNGGKKVRFAKGSKVKALSSIEVTGINPDWGKKEPIAGKKK